MQRMNRTSRGSGIRASAAFTLTELMVAVGVLVVVIVAAAKIFSSASKVSAVAEANADLIQTATAIEQQIRADFSNLPKNTFMVIQQVEVNPAGSAQTTVDPSLGSAEIRADQIAFFTRGARTTTAYLGSQEGSQTGNGTGVAATWIPESAIARVYYGHGCMAPTLPVGFDPYSLQDSNASLVPWVSGGVEMQRFTDGAFVGTGNVTAAKASNWPLVRLATLLGSDGTTSNRFGSSAINASVSLFTSKAVRLGPLATTYPTAWSPLWTTGRVDFIKWQPDDVYSQMAYQANAQQVPQGLPFIQSNLGSVWALPSTRLRMIQTLANWAVPATSQNASNGAAQLYVTYPRVEKAPPSTAKLDQMLAAPILAANCSSFKVEWTWADGVGRSFGGYTDNTTPNGSEAIGMYVGAGAAQPWFGLDDPGARLANSAVRPVSNSANFLAGGGVPSTFALGSPLVVGTQSNSDLVCSVEGVINRGGDLGVKDRPVWRIPTEQGAKRVYQAVFGFNQDEPSNVNPSSGQRGPYTPLPSAVRITVRLHDALGRIEGGRVFQFIVDLPKR